MSPVDGRTQLYAVLGEPVDHSRSPEIQNAAFRAAGMNAVYVALEVPAPRLERALEGLHAARVLGLNVTSPHKEAAFGLVRERTAEAEEARAVNTLRWEPEGWRGHATDGAGFLQWIEEAKIDLAGRSVLVLGAGGAVRAIVPKLLERGPETIRIVSRTGAHARALAERAGASPGKTRFQTAALADAPTGAWDLLVRALATESVSAEEERWWSTPSPHAAVLDLNYGSRAASARLLAAGSGIRYEDGTSLLVHQGAASFEFWTGQEAPVKAMREALRSTT
jgi:shikimate dehydrogenase